MARFADFFTSVHGFQPFPWQQMLADHLAETGRWPAVIDLPTASGKTAVLDIAVWHLANQAELAPEKRTAPRRIWFVVDRRIVVDEAYSRATRIAHWLAENRNNEIAQALYEVSGFAGQAKTIPPLSYGRLRGGILRDNGWASFPSQPAILTSTVDQFGSRLLFRGYGMGSGMWPVHAALAGNDSLLVLDEAHLAEPLVQTLKAFQRYRGAAWAEQPIALPWQMTVMSATPRPDAKDRFPRLNQRDEALADPLLEQRRKASKVALLQRVDEPKSSKKRPADACAADAAKAAAAFVNDGRRRVAVMLNRVDAAIAAYGELAQRNDIEAVLLTGRMRPFDRDRLLKQWAPVLASNNKLTPEKPVVLVTTQCLEVGADFSFDALVTECASLDALRQRFGRLDRLGHLQYTTAVILAWHGDVNADASDPIYGDALRHTWNWLNERVANRRIDFGIDAMGVQLDGADLAPVLPPRRDAPILLPAYLDAWCQTGPTPRTEPEVSLFLHGQDGGQADVQVAFRSDLTEELSREDWAHIVRLTPPASTELLTVRLHRLRQWLSNDTTTAEGDVEGVDGSGETKQVDPPPQRWVRYRGQDEQTRVQHDARDIRPGDVLILPAGHHIPCDLGHGNEFSRVDIHELAVAESGRPQTFRLITARLEQWKADHPEFEETERLDEWLETEDRELPERSEWPEVRDIVLDLAPQELQVAINQLGEDPAIAWHPGGGIVLTSLRRPSRQRKPGQQPDQHDSQADQGEIEVDPFTRDDQPSLIGEEVSLSAHHQQTERLARHFASRCIPQYMDVLGVGGDLHDCGKIDPRFQALLRNSPIPNADEEDPLAKSGRSPSPRDRQLREQLGINGFRHEMLSMQLSSHHHDHDLLLHLIASHHGHARPFAPIFNDDIWTGLPPHHLGSGVADRFWRLTRRHGWWGLAYLEAVLRLADHHASRFPVDGSQEVNTDSRESLPSQPASPSPTTPEPLHLDGLDGANPLGFLAALGTLALCHRLNLQPRMAWRPYANSFRPLLWVNETDGLASRLTDTLKADLAHEPPDWCAGTVIKRPALDYRRFAEHAACDASIHNRYVADFAAAFASDAVVESKSNDVVPTRFSFANGQSGKLLLRDYRDLVSALTESHIEEALYQPWRNADACKTFRWEPRDLRLYALRSDDPGTSTVFSTHGANILAFWGLTLLPSFPVMGEDLLTTAFTRLPDQSRSADFFSWPIWAPPLARDVVAGLLLLTPWHETGIIPAILAPLGIHAVFRSKRLNYQKSLYFTPATAV